MYKQDMGYEPTILEFDNVQELNNYTYSSMADGNKSKNVFIGFEFWIK